MTPPRSRLIRLARLPFNVSIVEKAVRSMTKRFPADSLIGRLPPKHIDYREGTIRRVPIHGSRFELDLSDMMGWYAFWGFVEPGREKLYSLIRPGDVVFDIGANLGEVSLTAAKLVGPNGFVHAFEPFPSNYAKLTRNVSLNSFSNLQVYNFGLGNHDHSVSMVVADEKNAGMNRVDESQNGDSNVVRITTLDSFCESQNITRLDLIKVDVEGYEMKVLQGGLSTIQNLQPVLFLEVIDDYLRLQDSSAAELIELITSLGYTLTHAITGINITTGTLPAEQQYDVIAMPLLAA